MSVNIDSNSMPRETVFITSGQSPVLLGEFFVEVKISFWEKVNAIGERVSTLLGLKNFSLPFESKSGAGGKNPYSPCDSYMGVNASYMYRDAGEGKWGQEVRGMLLAEYETKASPMGAHIRSYIRASVRNPLNTPGGVGKAVYSAGKSALEQAGTRVAEGVNQSLGLGYSGSSGADFPCRFDVQ